MDQSVTQRIGEVQQDLVGTAAELNALIEVSRQDMQQDVAASNAGLQVCVCVRACVCVSAQMCLCKCAYVCVRLCVSVGVCMGVYVCVHVCACVCAHVCMFECKKRTAGPPYNFRTAKELYFAVYARQNSSLNFISLSSVPNKLVFHLCHLCQTS